MKLFSHIKTLLIIILIGITFTSCNYKEVEIFEVKNITLGKIKADNISLNTTIHIKNPNNYKIKITKYDLDVKLHNQTFKIKDDNANILIPKKFDGIIKVPLKLKSQKVLSFSTLATMYKVFSAKSIDIGAKGTVSAKLFLFKKKIKVDEQKTIKL